MTSFEHRVKITSDRSLCFLVQTSDILESVCDFTKSNYCVSLPMKNNLEMFHEIKEITLYKSDIVKMHKIMENNGKLLRKSH